MIIQGVCLQCETEISIILLTLFLKGENPR
nr:MAG TPA: Ferric uptake regulator family protein [Caudoviricetes sp.]